MVPRNRRTHLQGREGITSILGRLDNVGSGASEAEGSVTEPRCI
jgi:hypothetical protein